MVGSPRDCSEPFVNNDQPLSVPAAYRMRQITAADAGALMGFYNGLSAPSKRTFHPLGPETDLATCEQICRENVVADGDRYDLVVEFDEQVVGWGFICGLKGSEPSLGLGIADDHQQRMLGRAVTSALMRHAQTRQLPALHLTVVQDNAVARRLYESFDFVVRTERVSEVDGLSYYEMTAELTSNS